MFGRLVVLQDEADWDRGGYPYWLDWTSTLKLPLCTVSFSCPNGPGTARITQVRVQSAPGQADGTRARDLGLAPERAAERPEAGLRGPRPVSSNPGSWEGRSIAEMRQSLTPDDLFVFSRAFTPALKKDLVRESFRGSRSGVLACPRGPVRISRILVLDRDGRNNPGFVEGAVQFARQLRALPVVLTVARSERAARLRQQAARETLAGCNVAGDFDYLVGSDVRGAVMGVARWRGCQMVVVDRPNASPWWRWLRTRTSERLMNELDSVAFLVFPEVRAPEHSLHAVTPAPASGLVFSIPATD